MPADNGRVPGGGTGVPAGGPGRAAMLTVRFLVELATLAALAVAGASANVGLGWQIVLAIGGPVLLAVIWGLVMAPRARRRIADPARLVVEIVLFLLAALALALAGHVVAAVIYAVIAVGAAGLTRVLTPGA
jgi:Protein of unknown function (DUF2568)